MQRANVLLELADDELIIGWRDSEWTGIAPTLEEDVAFSSIAQNEIGHARALYELAAAELATAPDSSFPSAHAAHSVIYLWRAATIVLRLRPGMARATAVVVTGIVLTALIGLSRAYLEVHYLSDVSAGWALGAAAFSFCAAVGLLVSQVRQNPPQ